MHADLKWLAKNVKQWGGTYGFPYIFLGDGREDYCCTSGSIFQAFTRDQWQAARDELESPSAEPAERPCMKTQVAAWHAAEDEILASEVSGAEPCTKNPFSSPEEDEAWSEAEKRMDAIGQNGGTGEHYPAPEYDPQDVAFPQPGNPGRPASKYHVQIKGQRVDVYDILSAYGVTNPADAHAIKKMLCPGQRGSKDGIQDRQEAIVSLQRAIELEGGL